jgi:hypothetical protein
MIRVWLLLLERISCQVFSSEIGELVALREGLQLAHFYDLKVDFVDVISSSLVPILTIQSLL